MEKNLSQIQAFGTSLKKLCRKAATIQTVAKMLSGPQGSMLREAAEECEKLYELGYELGYTRSFLNGSTPAVRRLQPHVRRVA